MKIKLRWPITDPTEAPARAVIVERTDDRGKSFTATIWFDFDKGGVVVRRISADAITSNLLRHIPIDQVRRAILESIYANPTLVSPAAFVGKLIDEGHGTASEDELAYMRAARESVEHAVEEVKGGHPNRGRAADNDAWNARIAMTYLDFHARFGQRCVKAMAAHLEATPKQVSGWVSQARRYGWLTKAPAPGQAGGRAGFRLMRWLEEHEEET